MNKGYLLIFFITVLVVGSSCNSGYYAHLPRVKKTVVKLEKPPAPKITLEEIEVEPSQAASITNEQVVEDIVADSEEIKENKHKVETTDKKVNEVKITNRYVPSVKHKVSANRFPKKEQRNGYPDSSLWFFYVGVFLMVIGLIFIILPSLGFGVGIPFLITGAIIMIMGLFLT